jgi:hypothetical protein
VRSTTFGRGGTGARVTVARNREQWRRAVKKDEEAEEDEAGRAVRCLAAPRAGALYRGRGRGVSGNCTRWNAEIATDGAGTEEPDGRDGCTKGESIDGSAAGCDVWEST